MSTATKNRKTAQRVGERIRECRREKGWTQTEFAKRIGKLQSQVSEWENGEYEPQLDTLLMIAKKLNVEIGVILAR